MEELRTWNFEDHEVRTVEIDGEPWFVGKDVATVLGYQNGSKALSYHVDEEDKLNNESLSSLGQRGGVDLNYPHKGKRKKNKRIRCRFAGKMLQVS